jgi:hypothetical protein
MQTTIETHTILLNSSFCPSFSTFCSFLQLDLVAAAAAPWVCHGSCSSLGQTSLDRRNDALTGADGAIDCHRSRQYRTLWFVKLDSPIFLFRVRAFGFLFNSFANNLHYLIRVPSKILLRKIAEIWLFQHRPHMNYQQRWRWSDLVGS